MNSSFQDELWPHFAPLWTDLRLIAPGLLLAGGYGLFLKQLWLASKSRSLELQSDHVIVAERGEIVDEVRNLVAIQRWRDQTPRVTKDFDFIASLDLIASAMDQQRLHDILKKHNFEVVPRNARWQFQKTLSAGRAVILDFHAPSSGETRNDIRARSRRVKPQPSLGQMGIHGRENPEAIASELHPFSFTFNEVEIVIPNPVTLTLMKLIAMNDRRRASQDPSTTADKRGEEEWQARKHAEDVCRVIAMMLLEERELAHDVLAAVRETDVFARASAILADYFETGDDWFSQVVSEKWQREDLRLIQSTLAHWFKVDGAY